MTGCMGRMTFPEIDAWCNSQIALMISVLIITMAHFKGLKKETSTKAADYSMGRLLSFPVSAHPLTIFQGACSVVSDAIAAAGWQTQELLNISFPIKASGWLNWLMLVNEKEHMSVPPIVGF